MGQLRGEDLTMSITDATGAPVLSLARGITGFQVKPVINKIESNGLDRRRVTASHRGWAGQLTLDLTDTTPLAFIDSYVALVASGGRHQVNLTQRVRDPAGFTRSWLYPECTLTFDEGPYDPTSTPKLKIDFDTGAARIPV